MLAVTIALVVTPATAAGKEPLCDWLLSLGGAAQAQARGDYPRAEAEAARAIRARPHGPAAARANAALGLALLALDEPGRAAEALEVALGSPVPGRVHLTAARGDALLAAGEAPQAARLFAAAARGADLAVARTAALREAQALLAAGLGAEAVPELEATVRRAHDPAVAAPARLALARALRATAQDEVAVGVLRALWLDLPDRPESRAAGDALASWRAAGGPVAPESAADHVLRAERLVVSGRPDDALVDLDAAGRADDLDAVAERAALLRAMALLALGQHPEAERLAEPLGSASDPGLQRGARLVLARVAARAGRVEAASRLYGEVARSTAPVPGLPDLKQRDLADESSFLSAWLFYDAGELERGIAALEGFARANPRSRRAEDALWFAAWSRYRLGRREEADRAFARLARGPFADAALYWRGRLARGPAGQRALFRAAVKKGGDGWYALLARARLAALGDVQPRAKVPAARALPEVMDGWAAGRLTVAVELLGLGLRDEALAELRDLSRSPRVRPAAALVAQLAAFAGDFEMPFRLTRDHLGVTRRTVRWLYPDPMPDVLPGVARSCGVDPALLLAVMRHESSFRADVRSSAGAEGLLQLRPATAERLGALLGVGGGLGARLKDPGVAVPLGAHYLGLLLARFGDPAVSVAAYNAGPRPVAAWATERAGMPLDAWVESIPYRETRGYVKGVVAEWDAFRAVSGDPAPALDPDRKVKAPPAGVSF